MGSKSLLSISLRYYPFLSNPYLTTTKTTHQFFKTQASIETPSIYTKPQQTSHNKLSKFRARRLLKKKDAFPTSLPLHTKDPDVICNDIERFARQNKLREAFTILDYMDQEGIRVNPDAFSYVISACARAKSLAQGRLVHTYIRINGLENIDFLCEKLVKMYISCKSIEDARRVIEECNSKNMYPWNALLRGTMLLGGRQYREVLSTYMKMRALGVEFNEYSFSSIIKSFAGASAFFQGLKTHALLIKNGWVDSSILRTSLIDLYIKCGKVKLACLMFDEFGEKDIVVWGAMIGGLAQNRLHIESLEYMRRMISEGIMPNSVILNTILPVIGETWEYRRGKEVHAYVVKTNSYSKQVVIQSALIHMYCKCGDMDMGRRVFYASKERNAIPWANLMSGYAFNGRHEEALKTVIWMQQEGFMPDVVNVCSVLPVCAKLKALKQGKEIHAYAVKNWFMPNVAIETALMVMYSKCSNLGYTCKLFCTMEHKNVMSWTAMIDSCVDNGCFDEAFGVFRSMQLSKHRPDSVVMARMLTHCGKTKALKLGKEIHAHVLKKKFDPIPFVSAELIKMYGRCGLIGHAKKVFSTVQIKGSMTWTSIIEAYRENGFYREAIRLFDRMRSKGFTPNHFTFQLVLSICNEAGFADDACRIFNLMRRRYKMVASEEHYSIIIGLLMRAGRIKEAKRYIRFRSSLTQEIDNSSIDNNIEV